MKAIRGMLWDRRRRQSGSVLSAVLILTAFLAIIVGALTTEISTNFILSTRLVDRVSTEATVNSAAELAINQLQGTRLDQPCASLIQPALTLNGQTAVAGTTSCWPTVYEPTKFTPLAAASQAFSIEGTHTPVAGTFNDYVIGNPDGTVFDYPYGQKLPRWSLSMGGAVTGPTLVMADPNNGRRQFLVIPYACSVSTYCIGAYSDNGSSNPAPVCSIPTNSGAVRTRPALSPSSSNIVFYADGNTLEATDVSGNNGNGNGNGCDPESTSTISTNQPIVSGPVALGCASGCSTDSVYVITSGSGSSSLRRFTYRNGLALVQSLTLPWGSASGMVASSTTLPASLAITFQGGGVALVQIAPNGTMTLAASRSVGSAIAQAPYWCAQCGNLIGIGAQNGMLYLFGSVLNPIATFTPAPGTATPITTTPQADNAGNWYFGTDGGYVYEVQHQSGQAAMTYANRYGPMAQIGSSVQVGSCNSGAWICVYAGAFNNRTYLVPLDSHDAVVTACIGTAPLNCTVGANPRLWTRVEVGTVNSTQTVHVQGWSYYSP